MGQFGTNLNGSKFDGGSLRIISGLHEKLQLSSRNFLTESLPLARPDISENWRRFVVNTHRRRLLESVVRSRLAGYVYFVLFYLRRSACRVS
jgi:hypothetical protein